MNRPSPQTPLTPEPWPDPPTDDFLSKPRRSEDLLAHWEWLLWNRYRKAHEDGVVYQGRKGEPSNWDARLKAHARIFWERLATCQVLTTLCRTKPSLEVHHVLIWLFWYYDMVERKTIDGTGQNPPTNGVFGFRKCKADNRPQTIKRAQKIAEDLKKARALVARTPRDYFSADERKTLDDLLGKGLQAAQREVDPGPSAIVLNFSGEDEERTLVIEPRDSHTPTPTRAHGQPAGTGGDLNMYLTVLVEALKEIQSGRRHLKSALAILDAFSPPQFQKKNTLWTEDTLRVTVHQFMHQGGRTGRQHARANKLASLRAWLNTPEVRALCPAPSFLLHTPSASIADLPR